MEITFVALQSQKKDRYAAKDCCHNNGESLTDLTSRKRKPSCASLKRNLRGKQGRGGLSRRTLALSAFISIEENRVQSKSARFAMLPSVPAASTSGEGGRASDATNKNAYSSTICSERPIITWSSLCLERTRGRDRSCRCQISEPALGADCWLILAVQWRRERGVRARGWNTVSA